MGQLWFEGSAFATLKGEMHFQPREGFSSVFLEAVLKIGTKSALPEDG
jgi:hypothetical protein